MAFSQNLSVITLPVAADMSAKQYRFMKLNSSGQVAVSAAGNLTVGVLQDDPAAAGRPGQVAISGISKVEAGGTVTAGALVASDSVGRAVNAASGDIATGQAISGTTTAGEIVSILVQPQLGKIW